MEFIIDTLNRWKLEFVKTLSVIKPLKLNHVRKKAIVHIIVLPILETKVESYLKNLDKKYQRQYPLSHFHSSLKENYLELTLFVKVVGENFL